MNRSEQDGIRGPRLADPTKEHHRYLRALPEGSHFIEVTFRNIRTGESYPPKPHGQVFKLTPERYRWISERHPLPDTPEQALACLLQIALEGKVTPRPHPRRHPDYVAVFNKYHNAFFHREERGATLARTKKKLIQAYLKKHYSSPSDARTKDRKNLGRALDRWLEEAFPKRDFPRN